MLVGTDIFLRPRRQIDFILIKTERLENVQVEIDDIEDFFFKLIRTAKDMSVMLGKTAFTIKAMRHGPFITINGAQLTPADGKLPVTVLVGLVHTDMEGAIHRLKLVHHLVDFHGGIHILTVEIQMPGSLPQILTGDVRGVQQLVAVFIMLVLPVIFQKASQLGTTWLPQDQTRPIWS